MKNLLIFFFGFTLTLISCKIEKTEKKPTKELIYKSFGEKISDENTVATTKVYELYKKLTVGDTITVKFTSKIKEICTKKGCWMKLPLTSEEEVMVRFKDYGFFMPLDSQGKEVIIAGKAFVKITPVEELRHYAEDAGKSKEEIAEITEPKKEMAFLANGVLLK